MSRTAMPRCGGPGQRRARAVLLPRLPSLILILALACGLVLASTGARAGLFDDEEARKAIIDLRARVAALDDQSKVRGSDAGAAQAALLEQVAALRRSLLEINNQLEGLRADVARLRGSDEQLARDLAELQKRQKDVVAVTDERLRKLEPVKVSIDGRDAVVEQDEKKAYDEAIAFVRSGDFDKAAGALTSFQRRFPASAYGDSARFWHGSALYGKRDYKEAVTTLRSFVSAAPEHPRAAEALLALANSQAEMKDNRGAKKTLDELLKAYPNSEAAVAAKERQATLK